MAYPDGQELLYNTFNENVPLSTFSDSVADFRIRFSEVTDSFMEGTFSGTVYSGENGSITLADGKFKLKRFN
jgi:hypothetical protein